MVHRHILLLTYPIQGHINPAFQLAKKLIRLGIQVTFTTSVFAQNNLIKTSGNSVQSGLNFAAFSDGYDDEFKPEKIDPKIYMSELKKHVPETLRKIIQKCVVRPGYHTEAEQGCPITCLVYTQLLPWAAEVAHQCHIESALFWIQAATVLDLYYYYFNGYEDDIKKNSYDSSWTVQMPGLPLLKIHDLPSFLIPSTSSEYSFALPAFREELETLDAQEKPQVLVNTFDELEPHALKAVEKYNMIGIGPLVLSDFIDKGDDLGQKSENCVMWLNSKPSGSVVYISFGSLLTLQNQQLEEIAKGLLECGRPFLWVIRVEENLSWMEKLEQKGMIVPWCSQLDVLTHPSLGCFMTHCGWNSTLESIVCGVPMIAFPQWTDQCTNAKLIEDVWKIGGRVEQNEDGIVECHEIKRCIELVMDGGEQGIKLRMNAEKWKNLAMEAIKDGGVSNKNLKAFVFEEV